jgi:hypothetical protein
MTIARPFPLLPVRWAGAIAALLLAASATGSPGGAWGAVPDIPTKHDGWARFQPGAWQHIRIVTEAVDATGHVTSTSTTDRVTSLVAVKPEYVRLQVEITAEVAGKRFDAPVQRFDQGCHGERVGDSLRIRDLGAGTTTVEGRPIPCQIREYDISDRDHRKRVRMYYSDDVPPYVLRREALVTALDGERDAVSSRVDVIAVDMPQKVLNKTMLAAHVRTIQKTDTASTTTLAVQVMDVPGGVVASTTKELDAQGRLVRRSTLELVDWGLKGDLDTNDKFTGRRRDVRRSRRSTN